MHEDTPESCIRCGSHRVVPGAVVCRDEINFIPDFALRSAPVRTGRWLCLECGLILAWVDTTDSLLSTWRDADESLRGDQPSPVSPAPAATSCGRCGYDIADARAYSSCPQCGLPLATHATPAVPDVECPNCHESVPADFDVCWNCQEPLSATEQAP
jgi:hypothetical protein